MKAGIVASMLMLVVTGCVTSGPGLIVSPTGTTATGSGGTVSAFAEAYRQSAATVVPAPNGAAPDSSSAADKAYTMVKIGTELQYQLCADFFRTAGKEQQWLLFAKDALATIGTVTTGILGASGGSASAIAWVGLSTGAGITGINLYARNFLFSEDNVQAVQDMTLKAVSAARTAAISEDLKGSYNFASAVSALMDVQAVCEVQNILVMVRKSISTAKPKATDGDADAGSADNKKDKSNTASAPPPPVPNAPLTAGTPNSANAPSPPGQNTGTRTPKRIGIEIN